jgi:RNA recognition motif-containing protein
MTEDELKQIFEKFGCVKDVYFVKDRSTNERKDIAYVTFSKASEAALAIEQTNGKPLRADNERPAKVILANSRNEGSVRDPNEDSKMLRLFIIVPKSYTEKDIRNDFEQYGEIDYIKFVKDRKTGERRDLAYVKYFSAYHAALALEGCDAHYKPVFASVPRSSRDERRGARDDFYAPPPSHSSERSSRYDKYYDHPEPPLRDPRDLLPEAVRQYPNPSNETAIEALLSTMVTYEQANKLFDLMPCMEFCNYDQSTGIACAKYSTPQAAAYAKDKLDGFEYPPGYRLAVRFYRSPGQAFGAPRYDTYGGQDLISNSIQAVRQGMLATTENPGAIKSLIDTIQKAVTVLQQSGQGDVVSTFGFPSSLGGGSFGAAASSSSFGGGGVHPVKYCNIPLPDRQPLAPSDSEVVERLFIVATPEAFPTSFLEDCFCRFGNMIGAFFMPGKKYGYVKYASAESAHRAVDIMHGQMICGNKMKVMIAEQPPPGAHHADGKRKRDSGSGYEDFGDVPSRSRRMS